MWPTLIRWGGLFTDGGGLFAGGPFAAGLFVAPRLGRCKLITSLNIFCRPLTFELKSMMASAYPKPKPKAPQNLNGILYDILCCFSSMEIALRPTSTAADIDVIRLDE